jgi:hypothetical protein
VVKDRLKATGILEVFQTREKTPYVGRCRNHAINRGLLKPVIETHNMFVNIGLQAVTALLGGGKGNPTVGSTVVGPSDFDECRVYKMELTDQASPAAPAPGNTALQGTPVWTANADGPPGVDAIMVVSYPALGEVRFSCVIPTTDLNGTVLTEEGLWTYNGELVARTTFSYEKELAFGLQFDHTITFERA